MYTLFSQRFFVEMCNGSTMLLDQGLLNLNRIVKVHIVLILDLK